MRWLHQPTALTRLSVSAVLGVLLALLLPARWELRLLSGWCLFAAAFLVQGWRVILSADPATTRRLAAREDSYRAISSTLVLITSLGSLAAVVYVLSRVTGYQKAGQGTLATLLSVLGVTLVVLSWFLIHTNYVFRYAHRYYAEEPAGGIEFDGTGPPDYLDFAYLSFTIGMTFQVSDTNLSKRSIRRILTGHSLIAYFYSTVLVALTINALAGLLQ